MGSNPYGVFTIRCPVSPTYALRAAPSFARSRCACIIAPVCASLQRIICSLTPKCAAACCSESPSRATLDPMP